MIITAPTPLKRRTVLTGALGAVLVAGSRHALASPSNRTSTFASDPDPDFSSNSRGTEVDAARPRIGMPAPLPLGYQVMGRRHGVPPLILYGVALQESAKLYGPHALPWPWTLNVRGTPMRLANYAQAVDALQRFIDAGVRNVDAGLMQVNWGYHADKLVAPSLALDPYPNIAVGARILRGHFVACGEWFTAVGRYHSPADAQRAQHYATLVYRRIAKVPAGATGELQGFDHG